MFSPGEVKSFRIVSWSLDHETGALCLNYAFDEAHEFTETILFPSSAHLSDERKRALEAAAALLHLFAGLSYFKAAAPNKIVIETGSISKHTRDLLALLYGEGLGEFAYRNGISIPSPEIDVHLRRDSNLRSLDLDERALVAIGGGKDSCVSVEALRNTQMPLVLASVNQWRPIVETIEVSKLRSVHAERTLAPALFELNKNGALNGHVPVTAIVSMVLVALAIIDGDNAVVMSNERSASIGNLMHDGIRINHQFSKSFDVEGHIARIVALEVAANLTYFSLLRPLSELDIARRFAATTRYDSVFTSCNRAFRLDAGQRLDHWCCDCPKCRFVFLALAPFVSRDRLVGIFGHEMLDDTAQTDGFDELIGWQANKPFECVGEVEESVAAFILLTQSAEWSTSALVKRFRDELQPQLVVPPDITTRPFEPSQQHIVPARYRKALDEAS